MNQLILISMILMDYTLQCNSINRTIQANYYQIYHGYKSSIRLLQILCFYNIRNSDTIDGNAMGIPG